MDREPTGLRGLYLEDSYFLGLIASGATVSVRGLFALTRDHEAYVTPVSGEQHCYREGEIALSGVRVTEWKAGNPRLSTDPDGSIDLGSIAFSEIEGQCRISTDWFEMICGADCWSVTLD